MAVSKTGARRGERVEPRCVVAYTSAVLLTRTTPGRLDRPRDRDCPSRCSGKDSPIRSPARALSQPLPAEVSIPGERSRWLSLVRAAVEFDLWVALCVGTLTLLTTRVLGVSERAVAFGLVFSATLVIYNWDHLWDRAALLRSRLALIAIGLGGLALGLAAAPPATLIAISVGGGLCLLYSVPCTPPGSGGFKRWPGAKGAFVAGAVSTAVTIVPATLVSADASLFLEPRALVLWCVLFLICYGNVQLFDVLDIERDRRAGIPTLPVRFGPLAVHHGVVIGALALAVAIGLVPSEWRGGAGGAYEVGALSLAAAVMLGHPLGLWSLEMPRDDGGSRAASSAWLLALFTDGVLLAMGLVAW